VLRSQTSEHRARGAYRTGAHARLAGKVLEDSITITWQPPAANIDNSTPVNLLGYNVYRTDESQTESGNQPLNPTPITVTEYAIRVFSSATTIDTLFVQFRWERVGAGGES
jgi:hypothetical protein